MRGLIVALKTRGRARCGEVRVDLLLPNQKIHPVKPALTGRIQSTSDWPVSSLTLSMILCLDKPNKVVQPECDLVNQITA